MAGAVQDKVAQYKDAQGNLVDTSQEDLQTLSGKAGLQAQPTSPITATQIGANPNQAKMAATAQVQQSAMSLSQMAPGQGLATAERQQQATSTQTPEQQAQAQKAKDLSGLSGTGQRVQDAINAAVSNLSAPVTPAPATTQVVDSTSPLFQSATDPAALTTDLNALAQNPSDQAALTKVNADLGRDANSQLSPSELQGMYKSTADTVSGQVAQAVPTALTVADLAKQPSFGYTMDDLGSLLGVPSADLAGYTPAQLSTAVAAEQQKEFAKTQALDQASTSTALGSAERSTARQAGQDASASGMRATEDDVAKIQQSVAQGDQVQFNGQTYTAEDLLGNSQISKTVADYLNAPEGSATRTQLESTEPGLVQYIKQHESVLADAAKTMAQGTTQLAATQTANAAAGTYGGQALAPDVMSALIPGYDSTKIQGAADTSQSATLQYLSSLPADQAAQAVGVLNGLTAAQKAELATLSPDEVAKLQLGLGVNSPVMKALTAANAQQTQLQGISPTDADAVYSAFTGQPGTSAAALQAQIDSLQKAATEGLTTYGTAGGLDMDRDGKLDDPSQVYAGMQKQASGATLENAINGGTTFSQATFKPYDDTNQTPVQQKLAAKLDKYAADGNISSQDLKDSGILGNETQLRNLLSSGMSKNLDAATKATVQQAVTAFTTKNTNSVVAKYPVLSSGDLSKQISQNSSNPQGLEDLSNKLRSEYQSLTSEAKGYGDRIDNKTVQARIQALQSQMQAVDVQQASLQRSTSVQAAAAKAKQDALDAQNAASFDNSQQG